jgi:hypothetical protein
LTYFGVELQLNSFALIISSWNCQIKSLNCQKVPKFKNAHDQRERFQVNVRAINPDQKE